MLRSPSSLRSVLLPLALIAILAPSHLTAAKQSTYAKDDDGSGRRKNDLSQQRIVQIRNALLNQEIVLRFDWSENHAIHEGRVLHYLEANDPNGVDRLRKRGIALDYGNPVAAAGDVATITGMNFLHPTEIYIFFATETQKTGKLTLKSKYRKKTAYAQLSDSFISVDWIRNQLNSQAVRFLKGRPSNQLQNLTKSLPSAKSGLTLSGGATAAPSLNPDAPDSIFPTYVASLRAQALPQEARANDTVQLILEYEVKGDSQTPIIVNERRTLKYQGQPLPTYPVNKQFARSAGQHQSIYRQTIPPGAAAGQYTLEAEVCANGECISRVFYLSITR